MAKLNFSYRELKRALEQKLGLDFRGGKENTAWYRLGGKKRFRITAPKSHRGTVPPGTLSQIKNQARLKPAEFGDLIRCPMTGSHYENLIEGKIRDGLL